MNGIAAAWSAAFLLALAVWAAVIAVILYAAGAL